MPGARSCVLRACADGAAAVEVLLSQPAVIGLAIAGALLSLAASVLQRKGLLGAARASQLNYAGYAFMGLSMFLFITIGLRGGTA
jgi:hypothetical protein